MLNIKTDAGFVAGETWTKGRGGGGSERSKKPNPLRALLKLFLRYHHAATVMYGTPISRLRRSPISSLLRREGAVNWWVGWWYVSQPVLLRRKRE